MSESERSRREFLRSVAVGSAAVGAAGIGGTGLAWPEGDPGLTLPGGTASPSLSHPDHDSVKLGVASYSLRAFPRDYVIDACRQLGTPYVSIKSIHLEYELTPEELAAGRTEFEAAGLQIVGGGVVTLQEDNDEHIRTYFDYARDSGMPLMVIAPTAQTLPRIERFVVEYDIKVAVHVHGPTDPYFPGPQDVLPIIEGMDPRVGICVDVGHTARTGIDVVEAIAMSGDRVLDLHMKDLVDLTDRESQVIVGQGNIDIAGIFRQLEKMGYSGYVNLEYEIDAEDPLPGMKQSFAYMRGVLAGMRG